MFILIYTKSPGVAFTNDVLITDMQIVNNSYQAGSPLVLRQLKNVKTANSNFTNNQLIKGGLNVQSVSGAIWFDGYYSVDLFKNKYLNLTV